MLGPRGPFRGRAAVTPVAKMTARVAPTFGFLFRHPAHFIALGFGAGLAPVAPGTFGTLVAIPLAALLRAQFSEGVFIAAIVVFLLLGI